MTNRVQDVIAIDFGTTNTYIVRCPNNAKTPSAIMFDSNVVGFETALLYTNESSDVSPYIAKQAVNGWGMESAENRKAFNYRFYSHFKPNIEKSKEAQQNAEDFFKAVLRDARKNNNKMFPLESHVIIGVPSEANPSFRNALKTIAKNAGYGEVDLVDEPIGAMLDSISTNMFPLSEILAGFLVIDFGGGTCDFAFLQDGRVKHSWGDMSLGGQLFDDLFYRWYCDLYPGKEEELEKSGDAFYVRTYLCRQCKENFSQHVVNNLTKPFSYLLNEYGKVSGITWEEFLYRAKNYTPTRSFINHQEEIGSPLSQELKSGKTDLLQWFQKALESGLKEKRIDIRDIHVVALAGGSCQWVFVSDYCRNILKTDRFFKSDMPYAAIAKGLAVLPALEQEFKQKQEELTNEKPKIFNNIRRKIEDSFNISKRQITSKIMQELFIDKIEPLLLQFRQKGGKVCDLERAITEATDLFKPRISQIVKEEVTDNVQSLFNMTVEYVRNWLLQHDLRLPESNNNIGVSSQINLNNSEIGTTLTGIIASATGVLISLFVAFLGTALLATGPLGLLIGIIAGAAAGIVGREASKEIIKTFFIPSFALTFILTDKKLNKCREDAVTQLSQELDNVSNNIVTEIQSSLENIINNEINRLSVVNLK